MVYHVRVVAAMTAMLAAAGAVVCASTPDVRAREDRIAALMVEKLGEDARTIRVILRGDRAVLTGAVEERSTQELSEEVARSFAGVHEIENHLEAANDPGLGEGRLKDEAQDAILETRVKGRLAKEIGRYAGDIEVEAADGMVSLRGVVPDPDRRRFALETATETGGVRGVVDLIRVEGSPARAPGSGEQ